MKKYAVGVDIGGTKTAIGLVDEQGNVQSQTVLPTNTAISPLDMIQQISKAIQNLISEAGLQDGQLQGIGIGSPGPLDAANGVITCPPNLPNWVNIPITAELKKDFTIPIILENDANAATLAEKWAGAAQECEQFVYVTVSTGIGAGLYIGGRLVTGARGNAGDIGHMVIDPSKGTCTCGQKGCLEWVASGTAIARRGSEIMGRPLTTKEVFELYSEQDAKIVPLIEDVFTTLGMACVSLINTLDPEKIVIGGGVSSVGEPLFRAVQDYVSHNALNPAGRETPVVPAGLQQGAGMIGAASLIFMK